MKKKSPWKRAAVKSVSWKVVGILSLIFVSILLKMDSNMIGKITIAYHFLTLFLFIIHERIWSKIKYGKKNKLKNEQYKPNPL